MYFANVRTNWLSLVYLLNLCKDTSPIDLFVNTRNNDNGACRLIASGEHYFMASAKYL